MKSLVRVKAYICLVFIVVGVVQAFFANLWAAPDPVMAGVAVVAVAGLFTMNVSCERCGESLISPLLTLERLPYEKRKRKLSELMKKGYRLFPYRKKCVHCGLERY